MIEGVLWKFGLDFEVGGDQVQKALENEFKVQVENNRLKISRSFIKFMIDVKIMRFDSLLFIFVEALLYFFF